MKIKNVFRASALAFAVILLAAGGASAFFSFLLPPREGPTGEKHTPVIEAVAAQKEIRDGELWKIYIKATDPDGDLDRIQITFSQLGGTYVPDLIMQDKKSKDLNGALLVWARLNGSGGSSTIYGTAEIRVEDRAGNLSKPQFLEFEVLSHGPPDTFTPPAGFDAATHLGQAEFPLQTDGDLAGDGDDRGTEN